MTWRRFALAILLLALAVAALTAALFPYASCEPGFTFDAGYPLCGTPPTPPA